MNMDSNLWGCKNKCIFTKLPIHDQKELSKKECFLLFKHFKKGLYIRTTANFDQEKEQKYWFVLKDNEVTMDELSSKVRNMIRKCDKNCVIRKVEPVLIAEQAYPIYLSEVRRYAKNGFPEQYVMSESSFFAYINGFENEDFWGVFHNEILIGYSIIAVNNKMANYLTWKIDYEKYNAFYPSYGLLYRMNEYYLNEIKVEYVLDGGRSFTEHSNVQSFLIDKFNFRKAYSKSCIYFRWYLKPIVCVLYLCRFFVKKPLLRTLIKMYECSR